MIIEPAELRWRLGGSVGFGNHEKDDFASGHLIPRADSIYAVCGEPDRLIVCATGAGAEIARGLRDEDYGSTGSLSATSRTTRRASAPSAGVVTCGPRGG